MSHLSVAEINTLTWAVVPFLGIDADKLNNFPSNVRAKIRNKCYSGCMGRELEIDASSAEALSRWENDGGAPDRDVGLAPDVLPRIRPNGKISISHGIGLEVQLARPQGTHKSA